MKNEKLSTVAQDSQVNIFRMYALRGELLREISGIKTKSPTAYIRIKREFNITGSRKSVLMQISNIIEARNVSSKNDS